MKEKSGRKKPIKCLITAGPTREYCDPVRYISNPSSGKMGYAIAKAAANLNWNVDLVTGPVSLIAPQSVSVYRVETGQEMYDCVSNLFDQCDVLIMVAAVCDWRPIDYSEVKVKKEIGHKIIECEPVVDILQKMAERRKKGQCIVGFAAETDSIEEYAREKLSRKRLDWIIANKVGRYGKGFESDENEVILLSKEGFLKTMGPASKEEIGKSILEAIEPNLGFYKR